MQPSMVTWVKAAQIHRTLLVSSINKTRQLLLPILQQNAGNSCNCCHKFMLCPCGFILYISICKYEVCFKLLPNYFYIFFCFYLRCYLNLSSQVNLPLFFNKCLCFGCTEIWILFDDFLVLQSRMSVFFYPPPDIPLEICSIRAIF